MCGATLASCCIPVSARSRRGGEPWTAETAGSIRNAARWGGFARGSVDMGATRS